MADHSKRAHALFNASSADFWMECNLWVHHKLAAEASGKAWDRDSEAARRGTLCHEVAELVLNHLYDHGDFTIEEAVDIATMEGGIALTEEEKKLVETAVEAATDLIAASQQGFEIEVKTEVPIPLSHEPESDGHVDVLAYRPGCVLVIDYKFGEGAVSPNSFQLRTYGANALDVLVGEGHAEAESDEVILAVVQPRLHSEALVRRYTAGELRKFQGHVEHVVEAQRARTDLRGASSLSTCDWCPAKEYCDHHKTLKRNMFSKMKAKLGTDPAKLDADFVEDVVRARGAITKLLKEMVDEVVANEARFPNWTRTQVANARKWSPLLTEEQVASQLIAKGAEGVYGLRSPAQVRDLNKKLAKVVETLSIDQGHHVRLYEGAPKSARTIEPPKRPTIKSVMAKKGKKK